MKVHWKVVGLAGVAGVAATGVVVARKRRAQRNYDPDELRARLQNRLSEVSREGTDGGPPSDEGDVSPSDDIPGLM